MGADQGGKGRKEENRRHRRIIMRNEGEWLYGRNRPEDAQIRKQGPVITRGRSS